MNFNYYEFVEHKLGELLDIKYGKDHKHLAEGSIPVYGSGGLMRYAEKPLYEKESILIPRKGSLNNIYYMDKPFWTVDTMFYSKIQSNVVGKFLYFYLKTIDFVSMNVGSAVPSMTIEILKNLEIPLPNLAIQTRIAAILTSLDDKIELNRQMNATLEAMAQTLFQEMCLPKKGEDMEGWREGKLGDVLTVKGGTTPSTKQAAYWNGTFHWVTPKDLSPLKSPVLLDSERKITQEGLKQISSGLLPKGTLLMSSRAPIGYFAISQIPVAINQGFIAINGTKVSNLFMLFWLKEHLDLILSRANGSTFLEISKSVFKEIELMIPERSILMKFDHLVQPLFEKIANNEQETQTLTTLRDSLLPKLMRGEITV